jgi:hypothetical protein
LDGVEDLKFAVEVFDDRGKVLEVLARLHDLERGARGLQGAQYQAGWPILCKGRPILRRSDRER